MTLRLALLFALLLAAGTVEHGSALSERGNRGQATSSPVASPSGMDSRPRSESAAGGTEQITPTAPRRGARGPWTRVRVSGSVGGAPPPRIVHAIRLASVTYGMPYGEAVRVAWCESRWDARARNRSSGATGVFQFLPGTWRRTPYRSHPAVDPYANALAAGWLWRANGGSWREWECQP